MTLTWIGVLLLLIGGILLFRGGLLPMLAFVLATSLFGASAAINLPALGGSSIPPTYMALGFLALRVVLAGRETLGQLGAAVRENAIFVTFCLYGAVTAFVLPRIFADQMYVTPMRAIGLKHLFDTFPLRFTNQNVTTAVYLIGTMLGGLLASVAARRPGAGPFILKTFAVVAWCNVGLAVFAVVMTSSGHKDIIDLFRNGSYAQLDQAYGGFIRLTGLFAEASSFAAYSFVLLIILMEAWMRDLLPRWTGPAAAAVALALIFSTSSSAYLSLAGYGAILLVRWMIVPSSLSGSKAVKLVLFGFAGFMAALVTAVFSPDLLNQFADMLRHMTLDKADSISGQQRRFWAEQGIAAFKTSHGLGIGAGSFRSSSLVTSIGGSMGVIGLAAFVGYILAALKPLRASTYDRNAPGDQAMGAACGWAAVISLIPALVAAPSPDPGLLFAVLAGLAITFRAATVRAPAPVQVLTPQVSVVTREPAHQVAPRLPYVRPSSRPGAS